MLNKTVLIDTLLACRNHHERMSYAYGKIKNLIPLDEEKYRQLSGDDVSYFDQLIYRFSKLQDTMGNKLFRLILQWLEEETETLSFLDILNKLEKLNILDNKDQWLLFREIRNEVTHEYPFNREDVIRGLNELGKHCLLLSKIWLGMEDYCIRKFELVLPS